MSISGRKIGKNQEEINISGAATAKQVQVWAHFFKNQKITKYIILSRFKSLF